MLCSALKEQSFQLLYKTGANLALTLLHSECINKLDSAMSQLKCKQEYENTLELQDSNTDGSFTTAVSDPS